MRPRMAFVAVFSSVCVSQNDNKFFWMARLVLPHSIFSRGKTGLRRAGPSPSGGAAGRGEATSIKAAACPVSVLLCPSRKNADSKLGVDRRARRARKTSARRRRASGSSASAAATTSTAAAATTTLARGQRAFGAQADGARKRAAAFFSHGEHHLVPPSQPPQPPPQPPPQCLMRPRLAPGISLAIFGRE